MPDPNTRLDTLEDSMKRAFNAIEALADKQVRLDEVIALLTEAQIKSEERSIRTDTRIESLVSAIGELIRDRRN